MNLTKQLNVIAILNFLITSSSKCIEISAFCRIVCHIEVLVGITRIRFICLGYISYYYIRILCVSIFLEGTTNCQSLSYRNSIHFHFQTRFKNLYRSIRLIVLNSTLEVHNLTYYLNICIKTDFLGWIRFSAIYLKSNSFVAGTGTFLISNPESLVFESRVKIIYNLGYVSLNSIAFFRRIFVVFVRLSQTLTDLQSFCHCDGVNSFNHTLFEHFELYTHTIVLDSSSVVLDLTFDLYQCIQTNLCLSFRFSTINIECFCLVRGTSSFLICNPESLVLISSVVSLCDIAGITLDYVLNGRNRLVSQFLTNLQSLSYGDGICFCWLLLFDGTVAFYFSQELNDRIDNL